MATGGLQGAQAAPRAGTTKNDEGREFPFTQELEAALLAQRAYGDQIEREHGLICRYVFHRDGERIRYWRRAWLQALLKVGLAQRRRTRTASRRRAARSSRR